MKERMRTRLFRAAAVLLSCLMLLLAAVLYRYEHTNFQGISIENREETVRAIRQGYVNRAEIITLRFTAHTASHEDLQDTVALMIEDVFAETGVPDEGDYLRYQTGGYTIDYHIEPRHFGSFAYTLEITPVLYTDSEEEAAVTAEVERLLQTPAFTEAKTDAAKLRAIYDHLRTTVRYDTVHKNKENHKKKNTAYAALLYRSAVCQGYAEAFYRLAREAGIECRIVTGDVTLEGLTERHAWNIAAVDGTFYEIDVTLDSANDTQDFFLKGTDEMPGHVLDEAFLSEAFQKSHPLSAASYGAGDP